MVDWKYGQIWPEGREEQGMIERIEFRKTEEGFNGATWYEVRIYVDHECDWYVVRQSYSGMWSWSGDPEFPMAYDTFSGMMEAIADTYAEEYAEYIRQWAYEQEGDDEEEDENG